MTIDERFAILQATKPLPLVPHHVRLNPGPIRIAFCDMVYADRRIEYYRLRVAEARRTIEELTHATPTNP